jgi:hypothetical protein
MAAAPAWRVAGSSVTGTYHSVRGDDCQDRHRLGVTPGGALIAVVSDGAGSARFGGEGAAMLCEHVSASLVRALGHGKPKPSRGLLRRGLRAVCAGVEAARAQALDEAPADAGLGDYHATLVGAVVLPGKGGLFFHIGDGAALAVARHDGRWVMSAPRNGEYSHETYFFTESKWRRNLRLKLVEPGFDTIFVMTDGVTDVGLKQIGARLEPFMPFFEPIGRFLGDADRVSGEQALTATLDSEAVRARTNDDKTLVWAQMASISR